MSDDNLRNADLTQLSVRDMTPAQRAELKRRYADFIANFNPTVAAKLPGKAKAKVKAKKWVPGKKA